MDINKRHFMGRALAQQACLRRSATPGWFPGKVSVGVEILGLRLGLTLRDVSVRAYSPEECVEGTCSAKFACWGLHSLLGLETAHQLVVTGDMTSCGRLGLIAGELLAQWSGWWIVEVDTRQLSDTPFEPLVKLILRLREHAKCIGEVGALYVGEQEVSLRRVL